MVSHLILTTPFQAPQKSRSGEKHEKRSTAWATTLSFDTKSPNYVLLVILLLFEVLPVLVSQIVVFGSRYNTLTALEKSG